MQEEAGQNHNVHLRELFAYHAHQDEHVPRSDDDDHRDIGQGCDCDGYIYVAARDDMIWHSQLDSPAA